MVSRHVCARAWFSCAHAHPVLCSLSVPPPSPPPPPRPREFHWFCFVLFVGGRSSPFCTVYFAANGEIGDRCVWAVHMRVGGAIILSPGPPPTPAPIHSSCASHVLIERIMCVWKGVHSCALARLQALPGPLCQRRAGSGGFRVSVVRVPARIFSTDNSCCSDAWATCCLLHVFVHSRLRRGSTTCMWSAHLAHP